MKVRQGDHAPATEGRKIYPEVLAVGALVIAAWVGALFAFL